MKTTNLNTNAETKSTVSHKNNVHNDTNADKRVISEAQANFNKVNHKSESAAREKDEIYTPKSSGKAENVTKAPQASGKMGKDKSFSESVNIAKEQTVKTSMGQVSHKAK